MRTVLGVVLVCFAVGCATKGYQRADSAVYSLSVTRLGVVDAQSQIARALDTMNRLAMVPTGDLRPVFLGLQGDVKAIEKEAEVASWRADTYRRKASRYIDAWGKELNELADQDLRYQSAVRRSEVMDEFTVLEKSAAATRQAYRPLLAELQALVQYLEQDLTSGGVKVIVKMQR